MIGFVTHRYSGKILPPAAALAAWTLLGHSVYHKNLYGDGPIILARPGLYYTQSVSYFIDLCNMTIIQKKIFYRSSLIFILYSLHGIIWLRQPMISILIYFDMI